AIVSLIRHLRQIRRAQLLRLFRDILLPKIRRRYQLRWLQRRICDPLNGLPRSSWRRWLCRRCGQCRQWLRFSNGQRHLLGRILVDSNKSDEAGFVEREYGRRSPNGDDRAKPDEREAFPSHPFTTPTTAAGTRSAHQPSARLSLRLADFSACSRFFKAKRRVERRQLCGA